MNREHKYGLLSTLAISFGGGAALLFGIGNLVFSGGYVQAIIYGVLLLMIAVASGVLVAMHNTKWKAEQMINGLGFSLLPIWFIEAAYLLAVDYTNVWRDAVSIVSFVLTALIILFGGLGMVFIRRGRNTLGKVFTMVFLAIEAAGTVINLTNSFLVLAVLGNVLRLGTIGLVVAVLFMTRDASSLTPSASVQREKASPGYVSSASGSCDAETQEEIEQHVPPSIPITKETLRERLTEAKSLYDDGLISEEEYTLLKKKAIDGK